MDNLLAILNNPASRKAELEFLFSHLLSEDSSDQEKKEILLSLNDVGINYDHLSLLSNEILKHSNLIDLGHNDFIDTCGTGGSGQSIFNCSTLSAFTVASCGGKVIKHGNRSITSKSGSADFLERAGVNLNVNTSQLINLFQKLGICFLFAPNQHPKLKNVAKVRQELGVRTIFNILGPLVNPAKPQFQLLGTSDPSINMNMANALLNNGIQRGIVATSSTGIDEIVIHEPTSITEIRNNEIIEWQFNPQDYGFADCSLSDIQVQSLEEAYLFGIEVLNGKRGPGLDMVALNAGFCLYLLGLCDDLIECFETTKKQLISGKVLLNLNVYAKATQE